MAPAQFRSPIRRSTAATALAALLALSGCARSREARLTPSEDGGLPALMAQMGTPDEIARWAVRRCGDAGEGQVACYGGVLNAMLAPRGVRPAMETLERLTALDTAVARDGHIYAHGIGIAAYRSPAEVARTFAECTPLHQSGCYHGVIQAYFADMQAHGAGVTPQTVDAACRELAGDRWLLFQCAHGVGHGLTALYDHALPPALAGCDLLPDAFQREACYGGAFMENVVNVASPHHHAVSAALDRLAAGGGAASPAGSGEHGEDEHAGMEHGEHAGHETMGSMQATSPPGDEHSEQAEHAPAEEHAGHDMAGMAGMDHGENSAHGAGAWKAVDPSDPLYPCTAVGARYQDACYSMQTSVMLHLNGGSVAGAARGCQGAPAAMRPTCFVSLGRDINAISRHVHAQAIRLCGTASAEYRPWCHQGVVKNLIDVTSRAEDGLPYCAELSTAADKARCYRAVGEELRFLTADAAQRQATCAKAEPGYQAECREGASLPRKS
jgi:hypothetical protein